MTTNVERIAAHVARHGAGNILIHTIPGSHLWLVCEKTDEDTWAVMLLNPLKSMHYELGLISDQDHIALWRQLTLMDIDRKSAAVLVAKRLRAYIRKYLYPHTLGYRKAIRLKAQKGITRLSPKARDP